MFLFVKMQEQLLNTPFPSLEVDFGVGRYNIIILNMISASCKLSKSKNQEFLNQHKGRFFQCVGMLLFGKWRGKLAKYNV